MTATTACSTLDCQRAAAIVKSGRIDLAPLVSACFSLEEASQGIAAARSGLGLKVVLDPW